MASFVPDLPAMTMASNYSRLPGRSGFFVRNTLWIGADHLLSVRGNPFSESYRRYYFADIQAIVTTEIPNPEALYGYVAAGLLILTSGALSYTGRPVWASLAALASLIAFFISWRSTDCACYLQTSVSSEKLPSLWRRGNARKAVSMLKAEIERIQGSASAELLATGVPGPNAGRLAVKPPATLRHCGGQIHWIAFALLVARGAIAAITLSGLKASVPLSVAAGIIGAVVLLLLIVAAIQQRHSDLALSVRRLVYVIFASYIASGLVSFTVSIYVAVQLMPVRGNPAMVMNNPLIRLYELIDAVAFVVLGCTGLILMWLHQSAIHAPPPLAPEGGA
jgi:hypothetical protein